MEGERLLAAQDWFQENARTLPQRKRNAMKKQRSKFSPETNWARSHRFSLAAIISRSLTELFFFFSFFTYLQQTNPWKVNFIVCLLPFLVMIWGRQECMGTHPPMWPFLHNQGTHFFSCPFHRQTDSSIFYCSFTDCFCQENRNIGYDLELTWNYGN